MKETKMKRMEAMELQQSATVDWAKTVMEPRVLEKEKNTHGDFSYVMYINLKNKAFIYLKQGSANYDLWAEE